MQFAKLMAATAALSLSVAPAVAADSAASKLSVSQASQVRASTATSKNNDLVGSGIFIGLAALVAVGLGIYVAVDEDDESDNELPTSP